MRAEPARASRERVVIGHDHPALAGRDHLARVEREDGLMRVRADPPSVEGLADSRRGILDDLDAVPLRDVVDRADVARETDLVDRQDGFRAFGDPFLDVAGVDVERPCVDVAEDDVRARVEHRVRRSDERERRDDDLVAAADADARQRQMQSGRAGGRRDAVPRADVRRDRPLELGDLRTLRHPAALDRLVRRARLVFPERRLGDRDVHLLTRLCRHGGLLNYTREPASVPRRQAMSCRSPSASVVVALNPSKSSARRGSPNRRSGSPPAG